MGLDEAVRVLEVAATVAEAVPVLGIPVKAALEAASKIVDFAKEVKAGKEQTQEIAEKAALWVQALVNALDEAKTDPSALERLRPDLKQIIAALTSIADAMELRKKQSLSKQILKRSKNEDELTKLGVNLEDAFNRFMLSSQIRNDRGISTLLLSQTRNDDAISTLVSSQTRLEDSISRLVASQSRNEDSVSTLLTAVDRDTLNTLRPVSSAYYDSLDSPSGCLEGTREDILLQMVTWTRETSPAMSIFWLAGLAGTGKSAIAKSYCEMVSNSDLILGTFFASRNSADRRDPFNIIRTLAHELAVAHPQIRSHVLAAIRSPPDIMQRPMREQIDRLLAHPLSLVLQCDHSLVIVVDALDECNKIGRVEGGPLIPLLAELLRNLPVKLLVTSRQEKSLASMFNSLAHIPLRLHEVASDAVEPDVRRIFDAGFEEIRREHELTNEFWPSEEDMQSLVRLTGRFFIFAATVLRYIGDTRFTPAEQLTEVLARGATLDGEAPYAQIDTLYTNIIQSAICDNSGNSNSRLRRRVGVLVRTVTLLEEPLSMSSLALLLGISEVDVAKDVSALAAVLLLIKDGDNSLPATVRIFHPSFRDFLWDSQRCQDADFLVRSTEHHHYLAHRCLLIMNRFLARDICCLQNPSRPNSDIEDLAGRLFIHVPGALQYACVFWPVHLTAGMSPSDATVLIQFCREHLLHWLELLSLLTQLPVAAHHLPSVVSWAQCLSSSTADAKEVSQLLEDTYRMLLAYYPPIRSHALHVYESAAVTMPECTLSRTINVDTAGAHLITARPGGWTATLQVLEGHTSCVVSVIFSPDGSQLASSSKDGTVRLWSARTGDQLAVFKSGSGSVASPVAFSPDGTRIMSGVFYDGTLRLWDTRTHDALPFLRSRRRNVDFVAFTPTDSPISVHDSTVCVWHLDASPKTRTVLKGHKHDITALAFSPDGCYIVSGSYDCMVRLWDFETGTLLATFRGHSGSVLSVSFSPVEDLLVSSSEDRTIRIWNTRIGEVMSVLRGHSQKVTSVAFSPHGRQVVSGSDDKTVRVWDVHSSEQLAVLQGHKSAVTSVLFSPNVAQNRVVSSSHDGTIRVWDMQMCSQSFEMPWSDDTNDRTISGVLSPDGACYVSTMREHARVWDVQTGKVIADLVGHTSCITSRDFSPNSLQFVSGSRDKTVRVWDTRSGHQLAALDRHQKGVKVVMFSPDGSRVVSGSDDHTARLWDVSSGEQLFVFSGHKGGVSCLTFSPDGLWVVSGSDADRDGTVIVWDVPTGSQVAILEGIIWLSQVVFSPDGTSLYVIQDDGDEIVCDFQHLVTSGCVPEARHAAEITDVESARTLDGQAFGRISWNRATGWISYTAGADPIPLCWLPVEQRGRDIICGWRIILDRGGIDENLTILDLTDAVERLRNEGLV